MNPLLKEYLEGKLGADYAQKNKEQLESIESGARVGNLFGDLGDVIAGRQIGSTDAFFQGRAKSKKEQIEGAEKKALAEYDVEKSLKSDKADQEKLARESDANSEESKLARELAIRMGMAPEKTQGLTAARFASISPALQKIYDIESKKEDNRLKREEMNMKRQQDNQLKQQVLAEKQQEKQLKRQSAVTEIQDRYNNITDNIDRVKKLVKASGTQELIGPENRMMQQYVDSIATDMAKLVDPTSVARETEVAAFRNMLFQPGFFQRESTVQSVLDNFKQMVDKRLENAYQVRGLDMKKDLETKEIAGETYVKVQGGWQKAPKVGNSE